MINPHSLLEVSRDLTVLDKRRPRQASLRRAISSAYYALFHLLIQDATEQLIGGGSAAVGKAVRATAARWFTHQKMEEICTQFQGSAVPRRLRDRLPPGATISPALQNVARIFVELQRARHTADYDPIPRYRRQEASSLVERAAEAFEDWQGASGDPLRGAFLLLLLTGESIIKER